jgi:hypothetical protein
VPNFNTLARVAKLVALLCFFLPWILVSCSGNEIAHGNGVELMTGHLQPSQQIADMQTQAGGSDEAQRGLGKAGPEYVLILGFAVIALGLAQSFAMKARGAAATMLITSVLGIALCFGAFAHITYAMNQQFERQEHKHGGGNELRRELGEQMQSSIRVEKQDGFWATIIALAAAALLSGATLTIPASKPAASDEDED